MLFDLSSDVSRGSAWAGLRADLEAEFTARYQREWDWHPELRQQYRSFEHYLIACRQWTHA